MCASAVPHGQDQDGQARYDGGDRPRRPGHPGLGHQVVGDLPAMPSVNEQIADHLANRRVRPLMLSLVSGQPGAQRVRGVGLDTDFAERTWCKHCADLGFHVEDMCVTSAVSL